MSKKEAEDASSEAAEDVSAKAARGIPGSSRGSDSGEGSAASTDTPAAASAESQRDAASGAAAPERGWFQWLWNLLWPVQTPWPEKPFNNTLGPAKNKTTEIGLQQSDLERLDAILRQERPGVACFHVSLPAQKACAGISMQTMQTASWRIPIRKNTLPFPQLHEASAAKNT